MILRSIGVQGWRCFADPMTVGPFGEAINVIHAPNAVGKSTLFEALLRGFFDGHRVGGREVESLRPWGRDLCPEVTLEFTEAGTDYRIKKRFLDSASSELFRKEAGKFVRLSEGEKADEFVRNLFSAGSPGRGLSKPAHWGLAQVLLVPQGELEVPELSGNLVEDIQESLGVQVSGPGMGGLEERIEAAYLRLFTPGGKLKTGKDAPRLVELQDQLHQLEEEQRGILEDLEGFEQVSRRVEDLRSERAQAKRDAESLDQELAKARQQAQSYTKLVTDRDLKQAQMKAASARHAELKQRIEGIDTARKELARAQEELERLGKDSSERLKELSRLNAQAEQAKSDLEEVRKGREAVDKAEKQAEDAERFVQAGKHLAELQTLLERIHEATQDLEAGKKELAATVAPDAKALKAIRKALTARDEAQVRLDAALITLEIVPQKPGSIDILSAEETGRQEITPGTPVLVKGAPEVVVDLTGIARIRARGPAGSVEELREEVNKETRNLEALTAGFGTSDIDELEARSEQFNNIQQKVSDAQTKLDTLLSNTTSEEIEQESRKTERIIGEMSQAYPTWTDTPPDADSLRNIARETKQAFKARIDEAELQHGKATEAFQSANLKTAKVQAEHDLRDREVKSISEKLEQMQKDGMDDPQRSAKLGEISLEWDAARSAAEKLETELSQFQDDPRLIAERLEKQQNAIQDQASTALESLKKEEGRLEQLATSGPYSALSHVEEQIAELKTQIDSEELRINAIRLLRDTVHHCKAGLLSDLRKPVEESATRMIQRIAGTRLGNVQLADKFQPQAVTPRIASSEVTLLDLSGGETEQVHLAVRLALAEVLAGNDRRFLVLDDILTATDTGRLARILSILEEAARRLQLFVLTCHPERYRGLSAADFYDLEGIVAGA